jgi:hypothetical protein
MYDNMTPQQRKKVIWLCAIMACVFLLVQLPLIVVVRRFVPLEPQLRALIEVVISVPISFLISTKIYGFVSSAASRRSKDDIGG